MENPIKETQEKQCPVILTESAIEKVKSMRAKDGKEDCGLRIGVTAGGCAGMSYDLRFQKKPYDNDFVYKVGDLDVYINPESLTYLRGVTIDYRETLKESGFQYRNPNAHSSCGCGTSFS